MKKFLTVLLSVLLAFTVFAFVGCTDDEDTSEINQYDYFDEYVKYSLYEYSEVRPANSHMISNSNEELQDNCWSTLMYPDQNVSIKDISTHSDFANYLTISIYRNTTAKPIVLTKLSLQIFAETDCEMTFSLKIGEIKPRATKTINVVANTATELLFENFAEYSWDENAKAAITITLENPANVGAMEYGFNNLKMTLRKDA